MAAYGLSSKSDERIKWSKQGLAEFKDEIRDLAERGREVNPPRILLIGKTGCGKSSLISSIMSALKGSIMYTSPVGERPGLELNTTKRFLEHRVFLGKDEKPSFTLCDTRGLAKKHQQGVARSEIERLIDGKLHHGDLMETDGGVSSNGPSSTRSMTRDPEPVSFVVFVQKARDLGDKDPDVREKLDLACQVVGDRGLPYCVVLTHIDEVKTSLGNRLHLALSSNKIHRCVLAAAKELGVNTNRVFVVKNYVDEQRTHTRHDLLLLRALRGILLDVEQMAKDISYRRSHHAGYVMADHVSEMDSSSSSGYATVSSLSTEGSFHGKSSDVFRAEDEWSETGPLMDTWLAGKPRTTLRRPRPSSKSAADSSIFKELERNAEMRKSFMSELTDRSGAHDFFWTESLSDEAGRSDESDYAFTMDDMIDDEGFDSMENPDNLVYLECFHDILKDLSCYNYPKDYFEKLELRGAKPFQRKRVVRLKQNGVPLPDEAERGLKQQLQKGFFKEEFYSTLELELQKWCGSATGSVWTSDTLHTDFGLPMDQPLPDSVDVQILLLAADKPACLLTLFDPDRVLELQEVADQEQSQESQKLKTETEEVRIFTQRMSRLLTTAIFNYCSCDFLLLPCAIKSVDFTSQLLSNELGKHTDSSHLYFGGPPVVDKYDYQQLKKAVCSVAGVSYVPRLLQSGGPSEEAIVELDQPWQGVVFRVIEVLTRMEHIKQELQIFCQPGDWFKVKSAVLEAARRLSFGEDVVVITDDDHVLQCCGSLKQWVLKNTGFEPRLRVERPNPVFLREVVSSSVNYVIILNCRCVQFDFRDAVVLRVDIDDKQLRRVAEADVERRSIAV